MTTEREALKLALEALKGADQIDSDMQAAITAIKQALAPPEQEPVALPTDGYFVTWGEEFGGIGFKESMPNANYKITVTAVPKRTWVGLTKEQLATTDWSADFRAGALWAEAKLKEKNT